MANVIIKATFKVDENLLKKVFEKNVINSSEYAGTIDSFDGIVSRSLQGTGIELSRLGIVSSDTIDDDHCCCGEIPY